MAPPGPSSNVSARGPVLRVQIVSPSTNDCTYRRARGIAGRLMWKPCA
jgi:hypothetical protein